MGADKTLHEAKYILGRLKTQSKEELTKSGLYHLCRNKIFKKADDMLPALDLLIELYDEQSQIQHKFMGYIYNSIFLKKLKELVCDKTNLAFPEFRNIST